MNTILIDLNQIEHLSKLSAISARKRNKYRKLKRTKHGDKIEHLIYQELEENVKWKVDLNNAFESWR